MRLDPWYRWLSETRFADLSEERREQVLARLAGQRDRLLDLAGVRPGDRVLDVGTGTGLLAFGAAERVGSAGEVVGVDISRENVAACGKIARELGLASRVRFLEGDATALPFPDAAFDVVLFRSLLPYVDRKDRVAEECARVLRPGGRIALFEPINRRFRWFSPTVGEEAPVEVREAAAAAEALRRELARSPETQRMKAYDEADLRAWFERAGFRPLHLRVEDEEERIFDPAAFLERLRTPPNPLQPALLDALAARVGRGRAEAYARYLGQRVAVEGSGHTCPVAYLWGSR